jgi:hypothetical protein
MPDHYRNSAQLLEKIITCLKTLNDQVVKSDTGEQIRLNEINRQKLKLSCYAIALSGLEPNHGELVLDDGNFNFEAYSLDYFKKVVGKEIRLWKIFHSLHPSFKGFVNVILETFKYASGQKLLKLDKVRNEIRPKLNKRAGTIRHCQKLIKDLRELAFLPLLDSIIRTMKYFQIGEGSELNSCLSRMKEMAYIDTAALLKDWETFRSELPTFCEEIEKKINTDIGKSDARILCNLLNTRLEGIIVGVNFSFYLLALDKFLLLTSGIQTLELNDPKNIILTTAQRAFYSNVITELHEDICSHVITESNNVIFAWINILVEGVD